MSRVARALHGLPAALHWRAGRTPSRHSSPLTLPRGVTQRGPSSGARVGNSGPNSGTPTEGEFGGRIRGHPPKGRIRGHPPKGRIRGHPGRIRGHPPKRANSGTPTEGQRANSGTPTEGRIRGHPPKRGRIWGHPSEGVGGDGIRGHPPHGRIREFGDAREGEQRRGSERG